MNRTELVEQAKRDGYTALVMVDVAPVLVRDDDHLAQPKDEGMFRIELLVPGMPDRVFGHGLFPLEEGPGVEMALMYEGLKRDIERERIQIAGINEREQVAALFDVPPPLMRARLIDGDLAERRRKWQQWLTGAERDTKTPSWSPVAATHDRSECPTCVPERDA